MKFTKTPPTEEGFYWCYIQPRTPSSVRHTDLEIGQVRKISNGLMRTVNGHFDFNWGDKLYWGESINIPDEVEVMAN